MSREWKPGDRFTLEFEVTGWSGELLECKTMSSARRAFPSSDMQHAKLIHPAAPEPQKLDVTKLMRVVADSVLSITYVAFDPVMNMIYVRYPNGRIDCYPPEELENIPEPKRTYEQIVELVPFFDGIRIVEPGDPFKFVGIKSRAKISYTEGEGWSIAEVTL